MQDEREAVQLEEQAESIPQQNQDEYLGEEINGSGGAGLLQETGEESSSEIAEYHGSTEEAPELLVSSETDEVASATDNVAAPEEGIVEGQVSGEAPSNETVAAGEPETGDPGIGDPESGDRDASSSASMSNLMRDSAHDYRPCRRGDIVEGIIVSIDKDGMMVDIGTKSEAIVPGYETNRYQDETDGAVEIGDSVIACVVQSENAEGHVVLSLSKARIERGWRQVEKIFESGESVEADVVDKNKGGLIVSIHGVRGFVPISQIVGLRQGAVNDDEIESKLTAMVGGQMPAKVLEINRRRNRLILSERAAVRELRAVRKEQLLKELQEGEVRNGKVSSICDFGAFIDLGGADGLVHLSELTWGQVTHPGDVVQVGEEVQVIVLSVDQEKKKIALSMRRTQPEPWSLVPEKYNVGDVVTATITKLATFGAFARVEQGVEGLIHVSELADEHVPHPNKVVKEGDFVSVRVIRVDAERRRLGLSLKQAPQSEDEAVTADTAVDEAPEEAAVGEPVEPVEPAVESNAAATNDAPETESETESSVAPDVTADDTPAVDEDTSAATPEMPVTAEETQE